MQEPLYQFIHPDELSFDPHNPRTARDTASQELSQDDVAIFLHEAHAGRDLVDSLAHGGYFPQDPMTVCQENEQMTVLDGNRRLSALRLLTRPQLAKRQKSIIPSPTPEALVSFEKIPVFITDRNTNWRRSLHTHLNGPITWNPRTKADFIHHLNHDRNVPREEIARQSGYGPHTVGELYRADAILRQANNQLSLDPDARPLGTISFPWLIHALRMEQIHSFLSLPRTTHFQTDPVPLDHLPQLAELLLWLYGDGTKERPPVVQDSNRDLPRLNAVISNPNALEELRTTHNLYRTHDRLKNPPPTLQQALDAAQEALRSADRAVNNNPGRPAPKLLGQAREIAAMADEISEQGRPRR